MAFISASHSTGEHICLIKLSTISLTSHPGRTGSAVAFIQTVWRGGFIFGSISSSNTSSFFATGSIKVVWNAWSPRTFACMAPSFMHKSASCSIALASPPMEKPCGKSFRDMEHTDLLLVATWSQSFFSVASSRPMTLRIAWGEASVHSIIHWPRSFMILSVSSKLQQPAAQRATYSPQERPAITAARSTLSSPSSARSFSRAAMPVMNITGMHWLSTESGPASCLQNSKTSKPRISLDFSSMSLTAGMSFTESSIPVT
mmetsp:Transcript_97303/g.284292  ORF Transcript_97303/g.284292 Transcript_97303/m.284292 type:complete len:259 (-) Transcript_97303:2365-3141(-)